LIDNIKEIGREIPPEGSGPLKIPNQSCQCVLVQTSPEQYREG